MNFLKCVCGAVSAEGIEITLATGGKAKLPFHHQGLKPGAALVLGMRPDDFATPTGAGNEILIAISVDFVEHLGSATYLYGSAGNEQVVAKAPGNASRFGRDTGEVALAVSVHDCHLFDQSGRAFARPRVPKAWN